MRLELTPAQKTQLGKKVVALKDIRYTRDKLIKAGTYGVVEDFGSRSGDPCINWEDDFHSISVIGTDIKFVEYRGSIEYILDNILSSMVKADDAPCSSYTHLAQAVAAIYKMAGDYTASTEEHKEELANVLGYMRLLHGS